GSIRMAAKIDPFHAQDIVAAAAAAGGTCIMVEKIEQPFVVEGCARHADRSMHAQRQSAALGIFTVRTDQRGREPVAFLERGRSRGHISLCTETNAVDAIAVFEAR